jgi:tyrosine-specific transport protein
MGDPQPRRLFGGIMLVAGCATGAGMLALPIATGIAGLLPSICMFVVSWVFMACTGVLLAEVCLNTGLRGNLISIAGQTLGWPGKALSWVVTLFLFYCLLVAYYVGMGNQLACTVTCDFGIPVTSLQSMMAVVLFTSFALLLGAKVTDWSNRILMIGLGISYIILIGLGLNRLQPTLLHHMDWSPTPFMLPIIVLSFCFHIVVPSLVDYSQGNRRQMVQMIVIGSAVPLVIYGLWQLVVVGNIPLEGEFGLLDSCRRGMLATHSLRELQCGAPIVKAGESFVLFAIITSLITVGMGFRDFLADGLKMSNHGWRKIFLVALALVPSLAFSLQDATVFLKALSLAGGFGVTVLFGILPPIMAWRSRYALASPGPSILPGGKASLVALMSVGVGILVVQIVALVAP